MFTITKYFCTVFVVGMVSAMEKPRLKRWNTEELLDMACHSEKCPQLPPKKVKHERKNTEELLELAKFSLPSIMNPASSPRKSLAQRLVQTDTPRSRGSMYTPSFAESVCSPSFREFREPSLQDSPLPAAEGIRTRLASGLSLLEEVPTVTEAPAARHVPITRPLSE